MKWFTSASRVVVHICAVWFSVPLTLGVKIKIEQQISFEAGALKQEFQSKKVAQFMTCAGFLQLNIPTNPRAKVYKCLFMCLSER